MSMKTHAFVLVFLLALLPAILLYWAARRRNRSPHWAWWGMIAPYGWIALIYLLNLKPVVLKAQYKSGSLVCTKCGALIKTGAQQVQQTFLHRILFGIVIPQIAAGSKYTCPNCGVIPRDSIPFQAYAKMRLTQIGLFLLVCLLWPHFSR